MNYALIHYIGINMTRRNPVTESSLISFISEWTRAFEIFFSLRQTLYTCFWLTLYSIAFNMKRFCASTWKLCLKYPYCTEINHDNKSSMLWFRLKVFHSVSGVLSMRYLRICLFPDSFVIKNVICIVWIFKECSCLLFLFQILIVKYQLTILLRNIRDLSEYVQFSRI